MENRFKTVVITGAAGFIGGALARHAIQAGYRVIGVDDFERGANQQAWKSIPFLECVPRTAFVAQPDLWLNQASAVFHLGARTDTFCLDTQLLKALNLDYSKALWKAAQRHNIPFIYASSAAVYGEGEWGYSDNLDAIGNLRPLNPYGQSKLDFDRWAIAQTHSPASWYGYRFFNVYGYGEHHKGKMASVVWHGYHQIQETGQIKLFRSYREQYVDGAQERDFISVSDVVQVLWYSFKHPFASGIYNLGTGQARPFFDLARGLFQSLNREPNIEFIDMPLALRERYQYHTQADMSRFTNASAYPFPFQTLEQGIAGYVEQLHQDQKA
jgi:ADP-L-glycero-D-manno-heptose 6-epimerase